MDKNIRVKLRKINRSAKKKVADEARNDVEIHDANEDRCEQRNNVKIQPRTEPIPLTGS